MAYKKKIILIAKDTNLADSLLAALLITGLDLHRCNNNTDAFIELTRCLRVQHDDPVDFAGASRHRNRDHGLEALLVHLRHVLHPRVGQCFVADQGRSSLSRDPAGEAVVHAQLNPADEMGVHP